MVFVKAEMEAGDESNNQVSDLCPQEDVEALLRNHPDIRHLVDADWSGVQVPDSAPAPSPTSELPDTTVFQGLHFFDVQVDLSGTHKKSYVVSSKLNKIFVDVAKVIPLKVKWDGASGLLVRCLMLYTQADSMRNAVRRCMTHKDIDNPLNANYLYREHVLACENSDARYEFDAQSLRYSVLVPLALQHGAESAQINVKFMCKTSCPGGINRLPTDIIFTLEDAEGMVHGRQKLSVKICSCPKRDKEKEEEAVDPAGSTGNVGKKKKKGPHDDKRAHQMCPAKKIKTENDNEAVSFLVTCKNSQVAESAKTLLKNFEVTVRNEVCAQTGTNEAEILTIVDNVSTIPHPYGQY